MPAAKTESYGIIVRIVAVSLAFILSAANESPAQQPPADVQVGQRVVQKRRDFSVHADNEPHERALVIDVWRVEKVDGTRVFLTGETFGITGWASSDQIISVEKGVDYFSQQIHERAARRIRIRDARQDLARSKESSTVPSPTPARRFASNQECAIAYEARAINRLEKREFDNAIADCNEALRIDPRLASAYYTRGVFWIFKHDCNRAIDDFAAAIRLDPRNPGFYSGRGGAFAYTKTLTRRSPTSVRQFASIPATQRPTPTVEGPSAYKKDYDKAIADLSTAIRLDPEFAGAFSNRAAAFLGKREFDKAIADCTEAIRRDPNHAMAYNNRGRARLDKGDYDGCLGRSERRHPARSPDEPGVRKPR